MTVKEVSTLKIGDVFICNVYNDYFKITDIYESNGNTYIETHLCGVDYDKITDTGVDIKWLVKDLLHRRFEKYEESRY